MSGKGAFGGRADADKSLLVLASRLSSSLLLRHTESLDLPLNQPLVQYSIREDTGVRLEDQDRSTCTGIKTVIN